MANRLIALQPETVIVADDHPLFRAAIREALESDQGDATFLEADSLDSLQALVAAHEEVDLVLLDLHMPGVHGFAGLLYLCQRYPSVPVVIISANEDPAVIRRAMEHGAAGFIPKSSSIAEISEAIGAILMGEPWTPVAARGDLPGRNASEQELAERLAELTPQQYKVLMLMMQGLLNKQIAYELDVSEATVKAHVTAIMSKLGVSNRTQAVVAAARLNVQDPAASQGVD
ncbi:MAG: response regulator transcription factor [Pseudomonadota bacterium]